MKKNRKKAIIISSIMVVLFIAPLIVLAVMYQSKERKNSFKPAQANIQVKEGDECSDELIKDTGYTLTADGDIYKVDKPVQIYDARENNDECLRVKFVPMWYDSDENICGGADVFSDYSKTELENNELRFKNSFDTTLLTLKLYTDSTNPDWSESWEYDPSDECFYYKGKIESGDISETLLSEVQIPKSVYESTTEYTLHIEVLVDAIQTSGNAKNNRW
ncbi:MAG: hypothetical protein K6G20_09955 [Ruminococcus sp.]|nr:hypothetical protein [Ruminococcus sp.]